MKTLSLSGRVMYDESEKHKAESLEKSRKESAIKHDLELLKQFNELKVELLKGPSTDYRVNTAIVVLKNGVTLGLAREFFSLHKERE